MPFVIRKNKNEETYKVTNKKTGKVYAKATKDPKQLIRAVEYNKHNNQTKKGYQEKKAKTKAKKTTK
jgi:hypothetical protein